jgi:hypothetical protein
VVERKEGWKNGERGWEKSGVKMRETGDKMHITPLSFEN